jgi:proline dehydrogenase
MDINLLNIGSAALRKAALNQEAKDFILSNPVLFKTLKKAADRYIGGENLTETVVKVKAQNTNNVKCSIEFMGENTSTTGEANKATDEFIKICEEIRIQNLWSTVSLDLSHIGLVISKEFCIDNLSLICQEASKANTEVIISAEGTEWTDAVIDIYMQAIKKYSNLSITMQAYLYRSKDDFKELIKENGRIRIVKGAYETPVGLSLSRGEELDTVYLDYVEQLLSQQHRCAIATHDEKIQQEAKKIIRKYKSSKDTYEFESLFGIQNERLTQLQAEGYATKLYFVYGKEWYLYVCNRIAEYPSNIFYALRDIVE